MAADDVADMGGYLAMERLLLPFMPSESEIWADMAH